MKWNSMMAYIEYKTQWPTSSLLSSPSSSSSWIDGHFWEISMLFSFGWNGWMLYMMWLNIAVSVKIFIMHIMMSVLWMEHSIGKYTIESRSGVSECHFEVLSFSTLLYYTIKWVDVLLCLLGGLQVGNNFLLICHNYFKDHYCVRF